MTALIQSGSFSVRLNLEAVPDLTLSKFGKIIRLAVRQYSDNAESLTKLNAWLKEQKDIRAKKMSLIIEKELEKHGYVCEYNHG